MKKYAASATTMILVLWAALSCHAQAEIDVEIDAGAQCGAKGLATPWIARIQNKKGGGHITGGILFSPKHVLVMDWKSVGGLPGAKNLRVVLGGYTLNVAKKESRTPKKFVYYHPIVILTLESPWPEPAACIMTDGEAVARLRGYRTSVEVLGWVGQNQLVKKTFVLTNPPSYGAFETEYTNNKDGFVPALAMVEDAGQYKIVGVRRFPSSKPKGAIFLTVPEDIKDWMEEKRSTLLNGQGGTLE